MSIVRRLALFATLSVLCAPLALAQSSDEMRSEFQSIIDGLNVNSFDQFLRSVDRNDFLARIYARRLVEPAVKTAFAEDFTASVQQMFTSSFPSSKSEILGTLVDFRFDGNEGRAVVRYSASGYRYVYHVYELQAGSNGRVQIIDWVDYFQGARFTDEAGAALVMALPSKPATRNMLANKTLDDGQVFQAGELFKSVRDNKPERFFQIYDGLDDTLLAEKVIVRLNWHLALKVRDGARVESAAQRLVEVFPADPLHSLRLVEYYIPSGQFDQAIASLELLQGDLGFTDGAIESLKASAALAMGNMEDAGRFAVQATESEPGLELSWWSLLRATTAAGNYGRATVALARLEDDFGENLSSQRLAKDRFLRVLVDKQEYLDWRASRD